MIEKYFYMMLSFVLEENFFLIVVFCSFRVYGSKRSG